nr:hypothetical protein [Tanacetum cinerariifolium]
MFIDKQVESESVDVVSTISSSVVKTVESNVESVDVKNKGVCSTIETQPIKKNNFSPLIIEEWNSDDERVKIKTTQAKEIADSKKRVKKLKRKRRSRTSGMNLFKIGASRKRSLGEEDASKQGRNLKQRSIFVESDLDVQAMMDTNYELVDKKLKIYSFGNHKLHKALQAVYEKLNQQEQAANVSTHTLEPLRSFNFIYDDDNNDNDDEESAITLN